MAKYTKKTLTKRLMVVFLTVISLTLIGKVTRANEIPNLKKHGQYEGIFNRWTKDMSQISPIEREDELEWSNPSKIAIYGNNEGHIFILKAKEVYGENSEIQQYITIDEYDSSVSYLSSKIVLLPYSLWGGFYNCEDGNFYVVVGQDNKEEDNKKVVYSIIKFNSDWKEVKRVDITGKESKTTSPFKTGKCKIFFNKGILTVEDFREAYKSEWLKNNEGSISFRINTLSMKVE